jgi:DNA-binding PadR family transcriptional regulator
MSPPHSDDIHPLTTARSHQRARYYTITRAGRTQLGEQQAGFAELVAAIQQILGST